MINFLGATPVPIPLVEERGFSFDLNLLRDSLSPKTKMLILNSPQNPTGGVIPADDIRAIADMVRDRDLIVLSDEIYSRIYFDEAPLSIATLPGMLEKTIILDGFSKTYAMTGWRMGYGVMPEWLVDAVNKLMVNSNSCTASFTQRAGIAALNGPQDDVDEDGGRVPAPPRCLLRRIEHDSGIPLRDPRRRILRVPQHHRDRDGIRRSWPMRCCKKPAWRA